MAYESHDGIFCGNAYKNALKMSRLIEGYFFEFSNENPEKAPSK